LANIKSAKKRILVTATKTARNKAIRSAVKTSIKKVRAAVEAKDKEAAVKAFSECTSKLDSAAAQRLRPKKKTNPQKTNFAFFINRTVYSFHFSSKETFCQKQLLFWYCPYYKP